MPVDRKYQTWWDSKKSEFPFECETSVIMSPMMIEQELKIMMIAAKSTAGGRIWAFRKEVDLLKFKERYGSVVV